RRKYHQSTWHYVNIFWQQNGRTARERKDLPVQGNLITRLAERATVLGDPAAPAADRAVALAWFGHLVGDVHQPLHTTARITAFEPKGDQGGNGFCLGKTHPVGAHDCSTNLHAFWDDLLTTRRRSESVDTIAASLRQKHGKPFFLSLGKYDGWARESYKLATTKAYPVTLFRRAKPTEAYTNTALTEAEARLALAGYRLGAALNALLR
ncbi:MAG: S1/P1 nuclease, partial [Verrucomicrobiales bacterium]